MARKHFIATTLALSIFLSGCQFSDLQSLVGTENIKTQKPSWEVDGQTYTTHVAYETAEGEESNSFTLTIKNETITAIEVGIETEIKASIGYQQDFAEHISQIIVGKKLSELGELDRVSGASNTTSAFNEAISGLKQQLAS